MFFHCLSCKSQVSSSPMNQNKIISRNSLHIINILYKKLLKFKKKFHLLLKLHFVQEKCKECRDIFDNSKLPSQTNLKISYLNLNSKPIN